MSTSTNLTLFLVASWALIITPGPDMLYVITRGIAQGRTAGLLSAMGVTAGIFIHTVLAALGVAVLLQTSEIAFALVKYVGVIYLVYLGIKAIRDKSTFAISEQGGSLNFRAIFLQGTLSNVVNPKVALFFLAFLPQFVIHEKGNVPFQMLLLGMIFAGCGCFFLCIVGYFAGRIGCWLAYRTQITSKLRWITGGILIGLGMRLAFMKRKS